jgi:hypothetical protein
LAELEMLLNFMSSIQVSLDQMEAGLNIIQEVKNQPGLDESQDEFKPKRN